jgi:hypothetical protein
VGVGAGVAAAVAGAVLVGDVELGADEWVGGGADDPGSWANSSANIQTSESAGPLPPLHPDAA